MKSHKLHWSVFRAFFASFVSAEYRKLWDTKLTQQHNFCYVVITKITYLIKKRNLKTYEYECNYEKAQHKISSVRHKRCSK